MPRYGWSQLSWSRAPIDTLSAGFSSAAAPTPQPQSPRARKRLSKAPAILVRGAAFGLPMVRHGSPQVFDCRSKSRKLASKRLASCVLSPNPKSKTCPESYRRIENPKCYLITLFARSNTLIGIVRPTCLSGLREILCLKSSRLLRQTFLSTGVAETTRTRGLMLMSLT